MENENQLSPNGYMNTFSGHKLDIVNPLPSMIDINDIATGLSNHPHFAGQTPMMFTVAQHSLMVAALCPEHLKPVGLLHDASEAYYGDMIKPLKVFLPGFRFYENRLTQAIFKRFGLDIKLIDQVKKYDLEVQQIEYESFFKGGDELNRDNIMTPYMAKESFLAAWNSFFVGRKGE